MTEKNKVLYVINRLGSDYGGPSRSVPNQCIAVANSGLKVGIAFRWNGEKLSKEASRLSEKVEILSIKSLFDFKTLWRVISRYDIVHTNGIWSPFCHLATLFARIQKKIVIIAPRGMLEPWALKINRFKKIVGYRIYQETDFKKASLLHATASSESKNLRILGLASPIAIIPNGVEIPSPKFLTTRKKNRILFMSRIHPKKGVVELVRAVATLREIFEYKKWTLTIAGPDEDNHLSVVKKEAKRLNVSKFIEYLEPVDGQQKQNLYLSSRLFVLPTYSENFGLVVAEALACGLPVITTQGAPWKDLKSYRCGWWHPVGQKHLETNLKKALLTSTATLTLMGKRGQKLIHQKYTWPNIGKKWEKTYSWLLGKEKKPSWVMLK